ncbi:MAG: hypothetical protein U5K74_08725 [Gemmatimonadaceae bacterium]|nr:hypothetical protein [Gemmatimonadaceae bacterium]
MVDALDATQLITPEIPVAIRLLAPHLATIATRAVLTLVLLSYGIYRVTLYGNANIFSFGLIAAATLWVAALAGAQEVRRLRRSGCSDLERTASSPARGRCRGSS